MANIDQRPAPKARPAWVAAPIALGVVLIAFGFLLQQPLWVCAGVCGIMSGFGEFAGSLVFRGVFSFLETGFVVVNFFVVYSA